MVARKYDSTGEAAPKIGIHWSKLDRLRKQGHIPEVMQAGRYFYYPADKLAAIRERLIASGHIDPDRERPLIPAPVTDRCAPAPVSAN